MSRYKLERDILRLFRTSCNEMRLFSISWYYLKQIDMSIVETNWHILVYYRILLNNLEHNDTKWHVLVNASSSVYSLVILYINKYWIGLCSRHDSYITSHWFKELRGIEHSIIISKFWYWKGLWFYLGRLKNIICLEMKKGQLTNNRPSISVVANRDCKDFLKTVNLAFGKRALSADNRPHCVSWMD